MRGNVQDIILIGALVFVAGIVVLICALVLEGIGADPNIQAVPEAAEVFDAGLSTMVIMGNSFIFIIIAFGLAAAIAAFYTETHPVFFVFSLLVFGIGFMVVWILSEVFLEIAATGALLPVAANFVLMVETIRNMPIIAILIGAVIIIALYAKRSDLQVGGGQA